MPSEYQTAVITCAAVLGIKTIVVALATVRARIMSGTFNFKNPEATNLFGALLDKSGLLLKFIKAGSSKQMVDIFERISLNNATNEPIFVGLALAGGLAAAPPPAILVKIFLYARIGHNLAFAFMPVTKSAVPRTACYLTGQGVVGLVAAMLLTA